MPLERYPMNVSKLNEFLDKKGITKDDLANVLHKDKATIYRKLKRKENIFSVEEAMTLKKSFNIPNKDFKDIFFT